MKVWILQTGEPLQIDPFGLRPMRAMNLSTRLIARGHDVTIWSSDFDHFSKSHRFGRPTTLSPSENLTIRLLASSGYKSNRGLARLLDHTILAINLLRELRKENPPDIAFVGYPPIEVAWVMTRWLKKNSVPSMLDVKDAWPEVLMRAFPLKLGKLARFLLSPYFIMMKSVFKNSDFISSISPDFLNWALSVTGRSKNEFDRVTFLTSPKQNVSSEELTQAEYFWDQLGIFDDNSLRGSYIGTLTDALSFERVVEAAIQTGAQIVISGTGPKAKQLKELTAGISNIIYPGWLSSAQAQVLSARSNFLLAPYDDLDDFMISLPNKFLDAMSFGRPIFSSLSGYSEGFIRLHKIGDTYSNSTPGSLSKLIFQLSDNPIGLYLEKDESVKLFNESFSGEVVYEELVTTLESINETWGNEG